MIKAKPFDIPKREVWEAFKRVKANQGAAGVDGQSIEEFEAAERDQARVDATVPPPCSPTARQGAVRTGGR